MKVNPELSVEEKYRTYALDYYRRNLKNKVMNGSEIPIDYVDPNACISNPKNSFCEFDNHYQQISHMKLLFQKAQIKIP